MWPVDLAGGASYPFRALVFLRRTPTLWGYIVVPIFVNIFVGLTVYAALLFAGFRLVDSLVAGLPEWLAVLGVLLRVVLVIGLFIATGFVLVRFGVVLGSPWYSRLSEELEHKVTGRTTTAKARGWTGIVDDLGRSLLHEAKKLLFVAAVGLILLAVNVVPVAGTILATAGGIALGTIVACLDFLDPPLERRRLGFRQKLAVIRRGLPASAGFGLVCLGLISIPFLNLLLIPICITAGTLFFCDRLPKDS